MAEPLKVVIWGSADQGPCSYYRGGEQFTDVLLAEHNVEVRSIRKLDFEVPKEYRGGREEEAILSGLVTLDVSPIEWGDVVVFRRYYNTSLKCGLWESPEKPGCSYTTQDEEQAAQHEHGYRRQDDITRMLWPLFRDSWDGGIIYETDDDHWRIKPWNGYYPDVLGERDLIREMTQRADLVTVATPALIENYGRYNKNIRVVRNAIDPDLYVKDTPRPDTKTRLVYYGSTARLRDYAGRYVTGSRKADGGGYAFEAVQEHRHLLQRVFIGTNDNTESVVEAFFDEQTPYISNLAGFAKALANSHGDIGIAPLGGDEFDRCKSELHWLEYAITDMAFIGQRFSGPSPYSVVRSGVDGLLARGSQEWHDGIKALATSPGLRGDLAGAAKERVLREYDYRVRAAEWADAFRWAAEHPRGPLARAA